MKKHRIQNRSQKNSQSCVPLTVVTPPTILHAASPSTTWRTGYCRPSSFSLLYSWFSSPTFCSRRRRRLLAIATCWFATLLGVYSCLVGYPKTPCSPQHLPSSVFALPVLAFSSGASSAAGPFFLFFLFIPQPEAGALHPAAGAALSTRRWKPSSNSCSPSCSSCRPYIQQLWPIYQQLEAFFQLLWPFIQQLLALPPAAVALLQAAGGLLPPAVTFLPAAVAC
jgi:hypothetical protein